MGYFRPLVTMLCFDIDPLYDDDIYVNNRHNPSNKGKKRTGLAGTSSSLKFELKLKISTASLGGSRLDSSEKYYSGDLEIKANLNSSWS